MPKNLGKTYYDKTTVGQKKAIEELAKAHSYCLLCSILLKAQVQALLCSKFGSLMFVTKPTVDKVLIIIQVMSISHHSRPCRAEY